MDTPDALLADAVALAARAGLGTPDAPAGARTAVLGIAGGPGSGKSTLAQALASALGESHPHLDVRAVPMDGFHLTNAELARRHLSDRKGAPETFDALGCAALLDAVRQPGRRSVWAPAYSRELHEPVPNAIEVPTGSRLVIVEGNWLALDASPWLAVRRTLDALWFLDVPWEECRSRLLSRRVATGRDEVEARAWVDSVDAENYWLAQNSSRLADRRVTC